MAVLRRRRGVILAITLIAAGLAFGLSLTQDETFEAQSSLLIKPAEELQSQAGVANAPGELPAFRSAQAATRATSTKVVQAARKQLGLRQSITVIQDRVSAVKNAESNLVDITAEAPSAVEAARLANAIADAVAQDAGRRARADYAERADGLQRQAKQAGEAGDSASEAELATQAARLEALATITDIGEVVTRATPPDSPASPKPVRNAVIAGFFGLLIGLVAAGLLESLDRRLRDPDEVQDELGLPLVGVVADHALGGVPISGLPGEEHVAAMDMFRMLRTNVAFLSADHPAKTVLVTSALPDEGKTTVATGLALASAVTGRRTLLVETDLHRPVHSSRLGLSEAPGLTDLLAGEATPGEVLQALRFVDPGEGAGGNGGQAHKVILSCISAGTMAGRAARLLGSRRFADFLAEVSEHYDLIVLDSAPLLAVAETLEILPSVDTVLYCVRLGKTTLEEAGRGVNALRRLPDRPIGLVLTDLGAADTSGYSYYSYSYSYRFDKNPEKSKPLTKA